MNMRGDASSEVWFAAGVRTPFAKVDGPLAGLDASALSAPVVRHMLDTLGQALPDLCIWGAVVPNLSWSNIAREILMDARVSASIPAMTTGYGLRDEHGRGDRGFAHA